MPCRRIAVAGFAVLAVLPAPCARADDPAPPGLRQVGTTHDACRDAKYVRFQIHDGQAKVEKNQNRLFKLSGKKKEITWYCGDSNERAANDEAFNWVRIWRKTDGHIDWAFYRQD